MILQIRATSGGGKTTAMRYLFDRANCEPVKFEKTARGKKVLVNRGDWNGRKFYVIGPYDKEGTGGCDRIQKIEQVVELVDLCAGKNPDHIVAFEGLLLAHSWGQLGEFVHAKYGRRYRNAFIDTSVEQCFANVLKRRDSKGSATDKARTAKIKANVVADHYRVELAHKRVTARGGSLVDVPYENSGPFLEQFITSWCDARDVLGYTV